MNFKFFQIEMLNASLQCMFLISLVLLKFGGGKIVVRISRMYQVPNFTSAGSSRRTEVDFCMRRPYDLLTRLNQSPKFIFRSVGFVSETRLCHEHKMTAIANNFVFSEKNKQKQLPEKAQNVKTLDK